MSTEYLDKQYIVFNRNKYFKEEEKENGRPAEAVLGIVRAEDEYHAQDAADSIFPDLDVFVKPKGEADPVYVAAGEKMGYLNTSEAHHP